MKRTRKWEPQTNPHPFGGRKERPPCATCGGVIPVTSKRRRYCSEDCQKGGSDDRIAPGRRGYSGELPSGTVGALHELTVSADLMRRGFHVFRALSPACPCDLLVLTPTRTLRVEVRTATLMADGRVRANLSPRDVGRYDVLAKVLHDGRIEYEPVIECWDG